MGFHVLQTQFIKMAILLIFALKPSVSTTPPSPNFPIANPNCLDHCGDLRIPFPFGTTENCYQSKSFFVTCNQSFNPPKLFWQNSEVEIIDISLHGQLRIMQFLIRECYTPNGTKIPGNSNNGAWIRLPQFFTVNSTANKFTIVGCDTNAFVSGKFRGDQIYKTGCTSICYAKDDLADGSCSGLGCCQTSIPKQVSTVELTLTSNQDNTLVKDFNNCSYAFLVEETAFNFSRENLTNLQNVKTLPMVVDWAIGNAVCDKARMDSSSYACKSPNSQCYKPDNGYGYRCNCTKGYRGNPYIIDGCQDIDECQDTLNICEEKRCQNTVGWFLCVCPKGYHSDGKGCSRGESHVYKLVAGIAVGVIVLMLAACFLYWELKRRRKQKYFRDNGGFLLQDKISEGSPNLQLKHYNFSELQKGMSSQDSMILAEGGYGTVCKGRLDDRIVSIKKSKKVDPSQNKQFIDEVIALSKLNHVNLVKLLGCVLDTQVPLLVYEFISNGTLYKHLHNDNEANKCSLYWDKRLSIAAETAGALLYLHSGASMPPSPHSVAGLYAFLPPPDSTPIFHKNVKSENIFLDDNLTVKVADFGKSMLFPEDHIQSSTLAQGTDGYLDPEYMQTFQLTEKSDVYSFGVVLVELLTGMKAFSEDRPMEDKNLANFFLSKIKKEQLTEILDNNIVCDGNKEQLIQVARLAKVCLNMKGEDRHDMKDVALELEKVRFGGKHSMGPN